MSDAAIPHQHKCVSCFAVFDCYDADCTAGMHDLMCDDCQAAMREMFPPKAKEL